MRYKCSVLIFNVVNVKYGFFGVILNVSLGDFMSLCVNPGSGHLLDTSLYGYLGMLTC